VEKEKVVGADGRLEASGEEQLRRLKAKADEQHAKLRRQAQETKLKCALVIQRKSKEVRMIQMANDVGKLRDVILENLGSVKTDLNILRQDVKGMLANTKTFMFNIAQELEYGTRRTAVEVSNFKQLRANQRAVQDMLSTLDDLFTPVMKPEYATGSHPWQYAKQNDPLTFYVVQNHGEEVAEAINPELRQLQRHYAALQRFSLYMMQQPEIHTPTFGRVLVTLGHRLLASPSCPNELVVPIRNSLERDRYLAGTRARTNLTLKYLSFRKDAVEKRAAKAMQDFGHDLDVTPIPMSPMRRRIGDGIARCKAKKAEYDEQRLQNAKALYGLWRSSGVDIWEGKRAPITRNPEAVWAPAPPMSKARRTARLAKAGGAGSVSMASSAQFKDYMGLDTMNASAQ
jgi:hypothetical protein